MEVHLHARTFAMVVLRRFRASDALADPVRRTKIEDCEWEKGGFWAMKFRVSCSEGSFWGTVFDHFLKVFYPP